MNLLFIIIGCLLVFVGLFMKITKKIELISRLDKRKKYNRDKLSAFAGNNLIYMGLLEILLGIITLICFSKTRNKSIIIGIIITYIVILTFFSFRVTLSLKNYEISKEDGSN
ncbi:membrane hypothetical protein [Candidatus Desulfosporosinus infrequens]|uniref:DUF3784 domain-containing protein n=1 Tax=Candidatus Desulfosporosinus infrequens TaxID=2043169 RepID=A0A2U3KV82_9FIRM|nr:membrane hypothetical protein [Candidatus Desulfosporosinus infrequens]